MKTLRIKKILISSIMVLLAIVMMVSATSAWFVIEGTVGNRPINGSKHVFDAGILTDGDNYDKPQDLEQPAMNADKNDQTSNAATPTSLADLSSIVATPTSLGDSAGDSTNSQAAPVSPETLP